MVWSKILNFCRQLYKVKVSPCGLLHGFYMDISLTQMKADASRCYVRVICSSVTTCYCSRDGMTNVGVHSKQRSPLNAFTNSFIFAHCIVKVSKHRLPNISVAWKALFTIPVWIKNFPDFSCDRSRMEWNNPYHRSLLILWNNYV